MIIYLYTPSYTCLHTNCYSSKIYLSVYTQAYVCLFIQKIHYEIQIYQKAVLYSKSCLVIISFLSIHQQENTIQVFQL
jgi:hypothetical protein